MINNSVYCLAQIARRIGSAAPFVDWAVHMLLDGHDSYHLRILAGMPKVGMLNSTSFETEWIFERALRELGLSPLDTNAAIDAWCDQLMLELATDLAPPYLIERGNIVAGAELESLGLLCDAFSWDADFDQSEHLPMEAQSDPIKLAALLAEANLNLKHKAAALLAAATSTVRRPTWHRVR